MKKILLSLIVFSVSWHLSAQNDNQTFLPSIKTVLLYRTGFEMAQPVMMLNDPAGLVLAFDDLDADIKPYKFTIIHCEADWSVSEEIRQNDYIDGDAEDQINDYSYSYNTLVPYTHYTLSFPTRDLKPRISGNYILNVYLESPDNPAFTRRFMVLEKTSLGITGQVNQANAMDVRYLKQEVDFTIDYNGFQVFEPSRQLKVVVTQNDRWDNAIRDIKPRFVRNESLDYNYDDKIIFNGGNEFRSFDIKSLKYQTERIRTIDRNDKVIKVYLLDDERRTFKKYATEKDINGRQLIKSEDNTQNSSIEADYVWVVFNLPVEAMRSDASVHIFGELTSWQADENSRMEFDFAGKSYFKELLLKQGYYNYIYVLKDTSTGKIDETYFEGNHWETENEYTIWVYFRDNGGLFDRLIAIQNINNIN